MLGFDIEWGSDGKTFGQKLKGLIKTDKLSETEQSVLYELCLLALHPGATEVIEEKLKITTSDLQLALERLTYYGLISYWISKKGVTSA